MSKGKLLIVDDEKNLRSSLQAILQDEGYQTDAVSSGEACLEKLKKNKYDTIFLDIWLPGKTGSKYSRKSEADIPANT